MRREMLAFGFRDKKRKILAMSQSEIHMKDPEIGFNIATSLVWEDFFIGIRINFLLFTMTFAVGRDIVEVQNGEKEESTV